MPRLQILYPVGLAVANIAVGWLLYRILDAGLGAMLASIGVVILLAVGHELVQPAVCQSRTLPHRLSRRFTDDAPAGDVR